MDYHKSNNENQFKDIQLQLHATKVTNPYTFSIQGNKSFSGICELDKPSCVIAYGSEPWYYSDWADASKVSDLTIIDGGAKYNINNITTCNRMFYDCNNITRVDLSNLDTSNLTDTINMFEFSGVKSVIFGSFNTSKVTDMAGMFEFSSVGSADFNNFNTSNVTNMQAMFYRSGFTSLDLSSFNTSNVTNMKEMFAFCGFIKSLNLSNFDTSKVTNMSNMFNLEFFGFNSLQTLDYSLTGFEANGIAPDLSGCTNLKTLRLHHATSANVQDFITKAKVPSTCNVIQVS